jgi:glutamate racemase
MQKPLMDSATQEKIEALFNKRKVLIALVDSGLGGLSICAEMEQALQRQPLFQNASLIYFNVWPEQKRGYNTLSSVSERIRVFNRALSGIKTFSPDLIMLACNTLSALYDRTAFRRHTTIPVVDIIDFGVDLIYSGLVEIPDSQALILGTRTTISENSHKERLIHKGIGAERIKTQACHGVATEIEKDPESRTVVDLIDGYVREAAAKIKDRRRTVLAALCCTHFGYSSQIFLQKIKAHIADNVEVLNPNALMSNFLFTLGSHVNFSKTDIEINVVSKIVLEDEKIRSISNLIRDVSTKAADALVGYEHRPNLFTI